MAGPTSTGTTTITSIDVEAAKASDVIVAALGEDVFEELPWHLKEQAEQAIKEREIKWPGSLDQ